MACNAPRPRRATRHRLVGKWFVILTSSLALVAACSDSLEGPGPVGPVGPVGIDEEGIPGSGTITNEQRNVTVFDSLVFQSEGSVVVTQATAPSLTIEADDNLHEFLTVDVSDRTLTVATQPGTDIAPSESIVFLVGIVDPVRIELAGAGSITAAELTVGTVAIVLSGTGDISIDLLTADDLKVEHRGVGTIRLSGETEHQTFMGFGVGDYDGADLVSKTATVDASGSSAATVNVTDELQITVSESGAVSYYGPAVVEQSISDLGTITNLGAR